MIAAKFSTLARPRAKELVRIAMRCALLLVLACGTPPHPATPPSPSAIAPIAIAEPARAPDGALRPEATAGLYWQPYVTCHDCATPTAIVAYVTPDAVIARRIVKVLAGRLSLGLPYVIHTEELAVSPSGIAVVTGTYSTLAAARAAVAKLDAIAGSSPIAIELGEGGYAEAPHRVTVVDRGAPVTAWSRADLDAVEAELDESTDPDAHATQSSQRAWVRRRLAARRPACVVQPGALFVVEDRELEWYAFAPVRCGATPAYIDWTASLLGHAVIVPEGTGHRLYQVVGAQCDSPIVESWEYDEAGRHADPSEPAATVVASRGGC